MPASDQHKLYIANLPRWELVRDCVSGSQAIKTRRPISDDTNDNKNEARAAAGTRYLPAPNPTDISRENTIRYEQYKTRANFVNFTGQTEEGFLGILRSPGASETLSPAPRS